MVERRVDVLVVRWYERRDRSPDIVGRWLKAARDHLPEAMPRRFGDLEPLRGRLDRDGEEGFARAHGQASSLLFLAGTSPVLHASLGARSAQRRGPVASHSLIAEVDANDERVRGFALALTHAGTVYVSASVAGGMVLDGGTLVGPPARPEEPYLAGQGDWLGLPPTAPIWCWFGPAYTRLLRRHVPGEPAAGGLFHRDGPWVPDRFTARLEHPDPARRAAARTPRGLNRSTLRLIADGLSR